MTLSILKASLSDAPAIQTIYAPIVRDTAISFETVVPSVEEMAWRIETALKTHAYLVAENAGQVAGYADASPHRARAAYQTFAYVAETARGAGVGKAL
jgi:L-amino acid N-acyltransferase YncA